MLKSKGMAVAIASLGLAATAAFADDAPAPPASPHTVTGNVSFLSDYVVRGLTQTNNKPAIQGTIEYGHASGFYAGAFGSNVSWLSDAWEPAAPGVSGIYGGAPTNSISASIEIDLYAGFRNKFAADFSYDVGAVYYWYPGEYKISGTPGLKTGNTAEIYGAIGWKWITAKVYYAITDGVFMIPNAQGSMYFNLGATVPIGDTGFSIVGGVGTWKWSGTADYLKTANGGVGAKNDIYDAVDYKIGVTKDWLGFSFGAFYWGSNADKKTVGSTSAAAGVWGNKFGSNVGDDVFYVSATKAF